MTKPNDIASYYILRKGVSVYATTMPGFCVGYEVTINYAAEAGGNTRITQDLNPRLRQTLLSLNYVYDVDTAHFVPPVTHNETDVDYEGYDEFGLRIEAPRIVYYRFSDDGRSVAMAYDTGRVRNEEVNEAILEQLGALNFKLNDATGNFTEGGNVDTAANGKPQVEENPDTVVGGVSRASVKMAYHGDEPLSQPQTQRKPKHTIKTTNTKAHTMKTETETEMTPVSDLIQASVPFHALFQNNVTIQGQEPIEAYRMEMATENADTYQFPVIDARVAKIVGTMLKNTAKKGQQPEYAISPLYTAPTIGIVEGQDDMEVLASGRHRNAAAQYVCGHFYYNETTGKLVEADAEVDESCDDVFMSIEPTIICSFATFKDSESLYSYIACANESRTVSAPEKAQLAVSAGNATNLVKNKLLFTQRLASNGDVTAVTATKICGAINASIKESGVAFDKFDKASVIRLADAVENIYDANPAYKDGNFAREGYKQLVEAVKSAPANGDVSDHEGNPIEGATLLQEIVSGVLLPEPAPKPAKAKKLTKKQQAESESAELIAKLQASILAMGGTLPV